MIGALGTWVIDMVLTAQVIAIATGVSYLLWKPTWIWDEIADWLAEN